MNTVMERTDTLPDFLERTRRGNHLLRVFVQFDGCQAHQELSGHIVDWQKYDDGNCYVAVRMTQGTVVSCLTSGDGWKRTFERVKRGALPTAQRCLVCCTPISAGEVANLVYVSPGVYGSHEHLRGVECLQCGQGGKNGSA